MKACEIYQEIDSSLVAEMLVWMREEERDLYRSTLAGLAANRKTRPVFVQKKPVAEQISWMHRMLKLRASNMMGEHLFQT